VGIAEILNNPEDMHPKGKRNNEPLKFITHFGYSSKKKHLFK
jgi:hypothetical protein